jgi:predicted nucleotidyltransferase
VTIDLNSVAAVAGESPRQIWEILFRCRGRFREDWLSDTFRYDLRRANEIAKAMELAGYLRRDRGPAKRKNSSFPWYSITDSGRDIALASAARRITRKTATSALSDFMKRVQLVNANPKYLYSVRRVAVFGSFLRHGNRLGDVDVAVDLKSRVVFDREHKLVEIFEKYAQDSGKSFSTFEEEFFWPRSDVLRVLKSRKRSISIQSWYSFLEMEKAKNFRYKVLLGDANQVRRELAAARRNQKQESEQHDDGFRQLRRISRSKSIRLLTEGL